jgi:hypothetical protein
MPMDEQDYRTLIALTQEELRRVGAPDLADPERYVYRDPETGELRRLDPKKQLMEMLRAFDRHLAIRDRGTYERALGRLNDVIAEGGVKGAFVVPTEEEGEGPPQSLGELPDLGETRSSLDRLIGMIAEDPGPLEGSFA